MTTSKSAASKPLIRLYEEFGQSPWLDNLKRSYITGGTLAELVRSGIRGQTSNPTIFQKAIQGSTDYDEQYCRLAADKNPVIDDYWTMVLTDINGALDEFAGVHAASKGTDGFVSVEVDPNLANDGPGTEAAARHLHQEIDRPNLMVKIPATAEGVEPIREMTAEGRNINITLIFSLDRYAEVIEAYLSGLETFAKDPQADLSSVHSVASFFISRVDTEVDKRLEAIGSKQALALRGKGAVAQGKLAYQLFQRSFTGPRWQRLADRGAHVQRPLWASTSTKNPAYPDTLYVDELIAPDTVNTLTEATIEAFSDHGTFERRADADVDQAEQVWADLTAVGVDLDDVGDTLETEGVNSFKKSFAELLDALTAKSTELRPAR